MSVFVLLVLVGGAFALCRWRDAHVIAAFAAQQGWRELRVAWAPFALWTSRRDERTYWLHYVDEGDRSVRRLCRVVGFLQGSAGVFLEPLEAGASGGRALGRVGRIVVGACVGVFVGCALGIGACLLLFPSSNVAPAYGIIVGAPLGFVAGVLGGALRRT